MGNDVAMKGKVPNMAQWEEYYRRWAKKMVSAMEKGHSYHDCEDAVEEAFLKFLQRTDAAQFTTLPAMESGWYSMVLWHAKGNLSHKRQHAKRFEDHHRKAAAEWRVANAHEAATPLDDDIRKVAAYETLVKLCAKKGIKKSNVEAYIRGYLYREPSEVVARECGIKVNNYYQIVKRMNDLLAREGKAVFRDIRRRLFIGAA